MTAMFEKIGKYLLELIFKKKPGLAITLLLILSLLFLTYLLNQTLLDQIPINKETITSSILIIISLSFFVLIICQIYFPILLKLNSSIPLKELEKRIETLSNKTDSLEKRIKKTNTELDILIKKFSRLMESYKQAKGNIDSIDSIVDLLYKHNEIINSEDKTQKLIKTIKDIEKEESKISKEILISKGINSKDDVDQISIINYMLLYTLKRNYKTVKGLADAVKQFHKEIEARIHSRTSYAYMSDHKYSLARAEIDEAIKISTNNKDFESVQRYSFHKARILLSQLDESDCHSQSLIDSIRLILEELDGDGFLKKIQLEPGYEKYIDNQS